MTDHDWKGYELSEQEQFEELVAGEDDQGTFPFHEKCSCDGPCWQQVDDADDLRLRVVDGRRILGDIVRRWAHAQ